MYALYIGAIVLVILVIFWYIGSSEAFRSCRQCDGVMPREGVLALNPFNWPYSGIGYLDDLYIQHVDQGLDLAFNPPPLTHLSTPDHTVMTG